MFKNAESYQLTEGQQNKKRRESAIPSCIYVGDDIFRNEMNNDMV